MLLLVGGVSSVGFRVESSILSGEDLVEICPNLKPSSEAQPIEDDIQGQVFGEGFFQFALVVSVCIVFELILARIHLVS